MPLLTITNLSIAFGHHKLLDNAKLSLNKGQRVGLIGRNGEGKSTLLGILSQKITADEGDFRIEPGLKIALLDQSPVPIDNLSVYQFVASGLGDVGQWLAEYHKAAEQSPTTQSQLDLMGDLQLKLDAHNGWAIQTQVNQTLTRLGLNANDEVTKLSGGWQRRTALARALVSNPDVLLLDEPTNHLDTDTIIWLERQILKFQGAILFVTHDREFLQNIATDILELDRGKLENWAGSYHDYLTRKAAALEQEERQNAVFDKKLADEEIWIRQGIKARRTRNEGRVRALEKLRLERSERRNKPSNAKLEIDKGAKSGKVVIEAQNISFEIDGQRLIDNFSTRILRGDRIGIIGPNGVGKTTLIKLLLKQMQPSSGEVSHGTHLDITYFDQLRGELAPDKTIIDIIGEGREQITINGKSKHVISYLADFLFSPYRARSPIKSLSGGERARVLLAKLFSKPTNLLVLDEPTNDLDIETLELLEELLMQFNGTLLMVSHDRKFLDNVVTSTFSFHERGKVTENIGGYSEWLKLTNNLAASAQQTTKPIEKPKQVAATDKAKKQKTKKLSFNEQQELASLPGKIDQLESEQDTLTKTISDPAFYNQSPESINSTLEKVKNNGLKLDNLYQRWSDLES